MKRLPHWTSIAGVLVVLAIVAAVVGTVFIVPESADALPAPGVWTRWYDPVTLEVVGQDGIDCEGNPYAWGHRTSCFIKGVDPCGIN